VQDRTTIEINNTTNQITKKLSWISSLSQNSVRKRDGFSILPIRTPR